jgi:hypothetical protein
MSLIAQIFIVANLHGHTFVLSSSLSLDGSANDNRSHGGGTSGLDDALEFNLDECIELFTS